MMLWKVASPTVWSVMYGKASLSLTSLVPPPST